MQSANQTEFHSFINKESLATVNKEKLLQNKHWIISKGISKLKHEITSALIITMLIGKFLYCWVNE